MYRIEGRDCRFGYLYSGWIFKFLKLRYSCRFDEELEQIKTKGSIGKRTIGQHSSRMKAIEITISSDKEAYETVGFGKLNTF